MSHIHSLVRSPRINRLLNCFGLAGFVLFCIIFLLRWMTILKSAFNHWRSNGVTGGGMAELKLPKKDKRKIGRHLKLADLTSRLYWTAPSARWYAWVGLVNRARLWLSPSKLNTLHLTSDRMERHWNSWKPSNIFAQFLMTRFHQMQR